MTDPMPTIRGILGMPEPPEARLNRAIDKLKEHDGRPVALEVNALIPLLEVAAIAFKRHSVPEGDYTTPTEKAAVLLADAIVRGV